MAMLTMEQVLEELEGKDENGARSLITALNVQDVKNRFHDYAFTYSKKAGGHTVCSGCGGLLTRGVERHGEFIRCPRCLKDVRVLDEWRGHKHLYEQMMVYIWQRSRRDRETILAKAIHAEKWFGNTWIDPEDAPLNMSVEAVYQFGLKGAKMYTKAYYGVEFSPNARSVTPAENKHGSGCTGMHAGFWVAAEDTALGEIADMLGVKLMSGQRGMHPVMAMSCAARKPYLRYVILQGQKKLAQDMAGNLYRPKKRTAKSMPELLGLTEGQWYEVRRDKLELTHYMLDALDCIQQAGNMTIALKEAQTAAEANTPYSRRRLKDEAPELLGQLTPKLRRKAVRRAAFSRDLPEWMDYWRQLRRLGEDMTDARLMLPKDMHAMHQRMTERLNALLEQQRREQNAAARAEFEKRLKKLRERYTFEACGLILRPFETEAEVIAEGAAQHICIGGYAGRYIKGDTILCALRRAERPEEPWHAIEFSAQTGRLVQDRGAYNDRGAGAGNLANGVEGWLKRFWAAFEARAT